MQRHYRRDVVCPAGINYRAIMIEFGLRKFAIFRLDAAPFDTESIVIETQFCKHLDVLRKQVVVIARVATGFLTHRVWSMFPIPPVVVPVATFNLVGRSGCSPGKSFWKCV